MFDSARTLIALISGSSMILLLAKVTIVAAVGRLAVAALPRATAATRHLVAMTTMVAILLLPVIGLAVPAWSLRVLPGTASENISSKAQAMESVDQIAPADSESAQVAPAAAAPRPPQPAVRTTPSTSLFPWSVLAVVLAVIVSLALIGRLLFGIGEVWTVAQSASDIDDKMILDEFERARTRLGIKRPVRVLVTDLVDVPVAWGIGRPVLLLPIAAMEWTRERLQVVFLHELAHVRRVDGIGLLLTRIVTSVYWFHPLVWMLDLAARRDCERACDDVVIASGERPSEYADHLLSIARTLPDRDPFAALALAISRPSQLEGRLLSILKTDARRVASGRATAVAAIAAALFILPIAALRLTAAPVSRVSAIKNAVLHADSNDQPESSSGYLALKREVLRTGVDFARHFIYSAHSVKSRPVGSRSGSEWFEEGRQLLDDERFDDSAAAFLNAASEGYRVEVSEYNAACAYARGSHREEAIAALQKSLDDGFDRATLISEDSDLDAIRSDPRYARLLERAMHTDKALAERRSALAGLERLSSTGSTDPEKWASAGADLLKRRQLPEAINALQRSIQLDPNRPNAIYNLACAYAIAGDHQKALDALQRSIEAGFGDADKVSSDSDLDSLHEDARFDQLVTLTEELTLYNDGLDDDDVSGWREALPHFTDVTRKHPSLGRAWFNLGFAQLRAEQPLASVTSYRKTIELGYRPPTSMYNLACGYAAANQPDEAFKWLEKSEAAGMDISKYISHDHDLDNLRKDPRFSKLRERVREDHDSKSNWF